mgnify:CR=1 FL=1
MQVPSIRGSGTAKTPSAVVITSTPYKLQLEQSRPKCPLRKEKPKKAIVLSKEQDENQHENDANWFRILLWRGKGVRYEFIRDVPM